MDQPTEKYFQRNANWMLWIAAATLVFINLLLPLILPNDASIGQISSFQRNGFLTLDTLETRKDALKPGDRVIKIDNCAVNDWIQFQCDRPKNLSTERVKFEISRDQRLITLYLPLERASIRSLFTHAPAELICSLLFLGISALIFFFKKDSAPANLLSKAFLLLGIYASSSAVGIQPSLMLYPLLFWFKLFSNGFAYIFLYAIAVELSLTYPKSIFSKTYLTKLLRWVIYLLVPLMALLILRFPDNPNTGLQNMLEFSQTITAAETLWLLIAYGYQLFTSARPSTRLSLRWINFGGVISICLLIIVYVSLANTGTIPPGYRPFGTQALSLNDPFLLLFLLIPLCFPVFIPSQYQLNIDLIIRQSLFYLTTLMMLGLAYMLLLSLSLPVAKHFLFLNNPIIMGLTLACGTFILHTPISQQINAFIDHIFYPSKRLYEKTLPKILIRLSENLDITELNQLLLEEIPEKLHLLGSSLLLVDEKTNLYFFTHTDNPNLGISVRHPYIAHLIRVRKILLRFFDAPNLHMGVGAFMRKYRIEVSIPLFHQDRLLGVYNLEAKKDHAPFTILDIQQLEKLKPWVETAIHNAFEITSMDTYSQRLEETVKQRSEELDRVVDQTEKTRSAAERASDVRNVFLGSVSHNIRTPMNTIIGAANLLLNTQLDQSQFEHVETIRQSSNDMISIINDILDYAVIETGHLALQRNTFEIDRIIQAVFNSVGPQAAEKKIEMIYQLEAHTPITIISDSARLRQILYNLVHNAVKYTDQGSVIVTVTAQPTKPDPLPDHLQHPERVFALTFTVRDTGQGIAPEDMPTLFAPHQNQESGGLGLAVSHRLCQILGGDITAQSEGPGKGATFTFSVLVETA
ncbi:MAG: hypothetical protein JW750_07905, partial [Anaerolineaceae bacterium]|nr:hypothetical protein [Anaerolineaceae bacterium]